MVAAGLVSTLSSGSLTVFAPSNAALAALLKELGVSEAELLTNKSLLTAVQMYHVLGQEIERDEIALGKAIAPVGGGFFKIGSMGGLKVTDGRNRVTNIIATDIDASRLNAF